MYDSANEIIKAIINYRSSCDDPFVIVDWKTAQIFDINPREFLSYAKRDLEENTDRGKINGLGNAKRAINCRVDEIIKILNFEELSISKNWGLPYKLTVLNSFHIVAPKVLTEWINKKRNLLEHEYERPKDIKHDIDIAELFIEATDKYVSRGLMNKIVISEKGDLAEGAENPPTILRYEFEINIDHLKGKVNLQFQLLAIPNGKDPITDRKRRLKMDQVDEDTYSVSLKDMDPNDLKDLMQYVWEREFKSS
jgi:hypothetical protein